MSRKTDPRVVAICGSVHDGSTTRIALEEVLAAARTAGATTELVDLRSYEVPSLYAADSELSDADALRTTVDDADSVVLGTPNYHGSYAGALKDALDHCGRDEFAGTTVGLLETAGGDFPGSALVHLRTVSRTLRAWTLPTEVAVPNAHETITDEGIGDEAVAARARRLGQELVAYAGVSASPERINQRSPTAAGGEVDD
ncbi:NAD(P)H-dependent oxidoreductase [Natrinema sp. SYSU A 869]|uniref:NADPH-dependent FMN reductase n=1 Tax=Natrinema sp. SYSU A 869 TaxID=2871694 RepID=UPI001CA40293|nr:NAD(P)H-dependent oxidoreductase [Natrinema sp. SYSU A 869]